MEDKGSILINIARCAISQELDIACQYSINNAPFLKEKGATFVTLTSYGQLRGCIGSLDARRLLGEDVKHNAIAAAFHDSRFNPVTRNELAALRIEISLLSPAERIFFNSQEDALEQLQPGIDGVILEYEGRRSTFLPQVWEGLPTVQEFMEHLKVKAGLEAGFWDKAVRLSRYSVIKWQESDE